MRVVGCFLEYDNKFVIFFRHAHKPDGNTWGLPGGKVEKDETDDDAIIRELHEETGYKANASELEKLGEYEFTSPAGVAFTYVTYSVKLKNAHQVTLEESAHAEYKWVTLEECDKMDNLIHGLHKLFRLVGYIKE
jgi:8-oxo-dGTP pyrophosphatase MutT (NUDIX family)